MEARSRDLELTIRSHPHQVDLSSLNTDAVSELRIRGQLSRRACLVTRLSTSQGASSSSVSVFRTLGMSHTSGGDPVFGSAPKVSQLCPGPPLTMYMYLMYVHIVLYCSCAPAFGAVASLGLETSRPKGGVDTRVLFAAAHASTRLRLLILEKEYLLYQAARLTLQACATSAN
jgi:hypothetical protein